MALLEGTNRDRNMRRDKTKPLQEAQVDKQTKVWEGRRGGLGTMLEAKEKATQVDASSACVDLYLSGKIGGGML